MPTFTDHSFLSSNGKTDIHYRLCTPDVPPRGIVQIAHGIAEHVERYDGFARFLAEHGFLVAANDHLGHGQSVSDEADLGFFAEKDGWKLAVSDLKKLHDLLVGAHPGLPCFLFGHSMGSFLARTYLIDHPGDLTGAVICGTGQQSPLLVAGGLLVGRAACRKHGARYKSEKLNSMAFGSYNKAIPQPRTACDWLTRDDAIVDQYVADPLCGFIPSAGLFTDMMGGIGYIGKKANLERMNKALPVFFIAGEQDPVGEYGKGVKKACRMFRDAGMRDVSIKLYPDCRHEILNELNKEEVMGDVLAWIEAKLNGACTEAHPLRKERRGCFQWKNISISNSSRNTGTTGFTLRRRQARTTSERASSPSRGMNFSRPKL